MKSINKNGLDAQLPLNERLKILIDSLKVSQRELCNKAKIEAPAFNRAVNGHAIPRFDTIQAIYLAYPSINPHFLLSGFGDPFASQPDKLAECERENQRLTETMKLKDEIISLMKKA